MASFQVSVPLCSFLIDNLQFDKILNAFLVKFLLKFYYFLQLDENVIGLSLQEILPDNSNVKAEKMLVANPPNILKRAKSLKNQESVSKHLCNVEYLSA